MFLCASIARRRNFIQNFPFQSMCSTQTPFCLNESCVCSFRKSSGSKLKTHFTKNTKNSVFYRDTLEQEKENSNSFSKLVFDFNHKKDIN